VSHASACILERFNSSHFIGVFEDMDDIDRKLLMLINENVRMPVREMAGRLGMSRQAVQKRLGTLRAKGAFKNISACISRNYLGATVVLIFGRSSKEPVWEALHRLGESEFTLHAFVAGGNYLYVTGFLRDISELDGYAEFVRLKAEMPATTVGIFSLHAGIMPDRVDGLKKKQSYKELTPLDLRIIASLRGDARRPLEEIADITEVSARTVDRHLEDMISDGSLEFDVPWDLIPGMDMITLIHVKLREGADRVEVGRRLYSKRSFDALWVRTFSNLPDHLLCVLSESRTDEIRKVLTEIRGDQDVLSMMPNHAYFECVFPTWRDRLTEVSSDSSCKPGPVRVSSRLEVQ